MERQVEAEVELGEKLLWSEKGGEDSQEGPGKSFKGLQRTLSTECSIFLSGPQEDGTELRPSKGL